MSLKKGLVIFLVWLSLACLSMLPFWLPAWQLDFKTSQLFYHPVCNPQGWLLDCYPLLRTLFYSSVPVVSTLIVLLGVVMLFWRPTTVQGKRVRLHSFYFVLVFVLGSGVVVNTLFKPYWGRPRPVQTQTFGGQELYVPPGKINWAGEGKSFSSGHSSVGFTFLALWFVWRNDKRYWAYWGLGLGCTLGAVIGLVRMMAGGHYLSDVIWSGWMMAIVAWLVYYPLMRIPKRELALRTEQDTRA